MPPVVAIAVPRFANAPEGAVAFPYRGATGIGVSHGYRHQHG
jgi:hypothetical protein